MTPKQFNELNDEFIQLEKLITPTNDAETNKRLILKAAKILNTMESAGYEYDEVGNLIKK